MFFIIFAPNNYHPSPITHDLPPMTYRPHNPGHDYYDKGIYLITLVVGNRDRLLGELNMDARHPFVRLSALGNAVMDECKRPPPFKPPKAVTSPSMPPSVCPITSTA